MRIGIIGIAGRMGRLLAEEVTAAGHEAIGTTRPGGTAPASNAEIVPDLQSLIASSDALIDFTTASTATHHASILATSGKPWILGTSGLSSSDEAAVAQVATQIPVVYSANFSPGVTLLLELAARMAEALPGETYDAEIIEMHHRQKIDAPSGTAIALGRAVASARNVDLASVTESGRTGHTGPRKPGAIGFAALRGGQVVGEHTLIFAGASEHLALTHRAFDRRVFATGAVRAAIWAVGRSPGLYAMRHVMAGP